MQRKHLQQHSVVYKLMIDINADMATPFCAIILPVCCTNWSARPSPVSAAEKCSHAVIAPRPTINTSMSPKNIPNIRYLILLKQQLFFNAIHESNTLTKPRVIAKHKRKNLKLNFTSKDLHNRYTIHIHKVYYYC